MEIKKRAETLGDFCASIGISYFTGFRAQKSGALRVIRCGRRILVSAEEIERVMREGLTVQPKPSNPEAA